VTRPGGAGVDADVVVVGAGLAGLTAARDLAAAGLNVAVLEARARVGGRTMTVVPAEGGWFDLGATWHWSDQPEIRALATDLGVEAFPEPTRGRALHEPVDGPPVPVAMPPEPAVLLRFRGGTEQLCGRLADRLPDGVAFEETVVAVERQGGGVAVTSDSGGIRTTTTARRVIVAVPPRLVVERVSFHPALPPHLFAVMEATPTWMGEALKCVAVYESPFWREDGWSGSAFSDVGPLSEVHDGSVPAGPGALWGFVALDVDHRDLSPDERVPRVLEQLGRLFGPPAADPVRYVERDWSADPNTCEDVHRHVAPAAYGHRVYAEAQWDGRLWWAGTETEAVGGGHLEGAVRSGRRAAREVIASLV
jgi:monoamine oxidase